MDTCVWGVSFLLAVRALGWSVGCVWGLGDRWVVNGTSADARCQRDTHLLDSGCFTLRRIYIFGVNFFSHNAGFSPSTRATGRSLEKSSVRQERA